MINLKIKQKEVIEKAKKKIKQRGWADEFTNLFRYKGFSLSISASKDVKSKSAKVFHANPHDVFVHVLKGQMNIQFKNKGVSILPNHAIVIPAGKKHKAIFPKLTICLVGAYFK